MNEDETREIAEREAMFREVNERLEALNESFAVVTSRFEVVCECGDKDCTAQLSMKGDDYEKLRSSPDLFVVAPGHSLEQVEEVVARGDGYDIVRKNPGLPTTLARETDPRGG